MTEPAPLPLEIAEAACREHGLPPENAPAIAELSAWAARQILQQMGVITRRSAQAFPATAPKAEAARDTEAMRTAIAVVAARLRNDTRGADMLLNKAADARAAAGIMATWLASWIRATDDYTDSESGEETILRLLRGLDS